MALKLAIGCCNYIFSEGLKKLLDDESEIQVIGLFNGGKGLLPDLKEILKLNPDVILTDFNPDFNIFMELPEEMLKGSKLRVLLIGNRSLGFIADKDLKELITKGVVGILPPGSDVNLLKKALKAVRSGELWLDRNTLMKLFSSMNQSEKTVNLAKREKEIVLHICQGYRNKEIAQKLNISEQTVKSHCNRIYKKIGVSDRLQLALYSYKIWPFSSKT
jgi:DNA-binding NarL/FixJ family response regulator